MDDCGMEIDLLKFIEDCSLQKLSKNFDQQEHHVEYTLWKSALEKNIVILRENLGKIMNIHENNDDVLSLLILLYKELHTNGGWTVENAEFYAASIDSYFDRLYDISLGNLLKTEDCFNVQNIFDLCLKRLHLKLTRDDFKKYPSLIQVYGLLLQDVKEYKIKITPIKTLPIALLLIDDYVISNKVIGLKSCMAVLNALAPGEFCSGNYQEVIFESLSKSMKEKDLDVTKQTIESLARLLLNLHPGIRESKLDDIFLKILEECQLETNLNRKVILLISTNKFIAINGINCVKRKKKFNAVMIENMDLCVNCSVREVLLGNVLKCIETWLKYCWYGWKYQSDYKLMSTLFKLLCAFGDDEEVQKVQSLIVSMISLCEKDERNKIINGLRHCGIENERFSSRFEVVLQNVLNKFSN